MTRAMEFDQPNLAEAFVIRGISYGQLGQAKNAMEDLAQRRHSIRNLRRAFRLNPEKPMVYFTRGLAYLHLGQYLLATTYFDEALRLAPQDTLAYTERGMAYSALGNHQQAIQDLDRAVRLDPDNAEAYLKRGLVSFRAGNYQEGLDGLARAVRLDPDHADEYRDRALADVFLEMNAKTQRDIERVTGLE